MENAYAILVFFYRCLALSFPKSIDLEFQEILGEGEFVTEGDLMVLWRDSFQHYWNIPDNEQFWMYYRKIDGLSLKLNWMPFDLNVLWNTTKFTDMTVFFGLIVSKLPLLLTSDQFVIVSD